MSGLLRIDEDFEWPKGAALDIAKETCVTRIFQVWEHRSAYFGYLSKRYHGDKFSTSLQEAQKHIETDRIKGSSWWITEIPACAFIGSQHSLLVVPRGSDFGKHSYRRTLDPFLSNVAAAFHGDAFVFLADVQTFEPVTKNSFGVYRSESRSGHARLDWNRRKVWRFPLAPIRNFAAIHQAQLSRPFYGILFEAIGKVVRVKEVHHSSPLRREVRKGDLLCDLILERGDKTHKAFISVEDGIRASISGDRAQFFVSGKRIKGSQIQRDWHASTWSLPSFNEILSASL